MPEHRNPNGETVRQRAQRARRAREILASPGPLPGRGKGMKKPAAPPPVPDEELQARRVEALKRELNIAKRMLVAKRAHDDFLTFVKFMMPSHEDPDDVDRSLYTAARHHRAIAAALEEVEKGTIKRLIVTLPPRHGKTELITKKFIPWLVGRDPTRHVVAATYSDTFALDFGREIRQAMKSTQFEQVFKGKGSHVIKGEAAADRLRFVGGGQLVTVGRGGALTGRGANALIIDDIIKDAEEAASPTIRDKAWEWFTRVAMTRLMTKDAVVVIVMTRWHADDIVGRLTDPTNAFYDPEEAAQWKVINLPAIAALDDPLGRAPGEALWPERFPVAWLEAQRRLDPAGFSALYQQRPTPEDGEFFKAEWIKTYAPQELPEGLSVYIASDHAVGTDKTRHDRTVWVVAGVDSEGSLWVLDAWIGRETTEVVVERMIDAMLKWKPIFWFAEKGHITSSIGPFLRKRMQERKCWVAIEEAIPSKNKVQRAQSIQAMMSAGRVMFPRYAHYLEAMRHELLTFPKGNHDDIVDALAWLGIKLQRQVTGSGDRGSTVVAPRPGTLAWIKWDSEFRSGRLRAANGGFQP